MDNVCLGFRGYTDQLRSGWSVPQTPIRVQGLGFGVQGLGNGVIRIN